VENKLLDFLNWAKNNETFGSPLFRVDIITKTNAGKLKKHLIHKE